MKNVEHLPEKFAFKMDEIGKRWIRETFGSDYYDDILFDGKHFIYPNDVNENGFYAGHHIAEALKSDYTEIPTSQLFTPQNIVPTIEKGVMMLVWDDNESSAKEREVMFFDGTFYYAKNNLDSNLLCWKNAKPIPQLPEYTIEEAQEIFKFKVKCTNPQK